jgi:ribosomal protein L21
MKLNLGSLKFEKRPDRKEFVEIDAQKLLVYDSEKVETGRHYLNDMKVKGAVVMDHHSDRDLKMFQFNKEDLKDI